MFETYDPKDIKVELLGQEIKGFAPGTMVKVSRSADAYSDVAGALGDVIRARNRDGRGTIELTLLDAHPCNKLLESKATADENTGEGVGPALVKHVTGREFASGRHSWVVKKPDAEYKGTESGTRTWIIRVANMVFQPSGYGTPPAGV